MIKYCIYETWDGSLFLVLKDGYMLLPGITPMFKSIDDAINFIDSEILPSGEKVFVDYKKITQLDFYEMVCYT